MNCREGDLAFVNSTVFTPELLNRFVIVQERTFNGSMNALGGRHICIGESWICVAADGGLLPARAVSGILHQVPWRAISDKHLTPIRDQDGEDEMITAFKKNKTKESEEEMKRVFEGMK